MTTAAGVADRLRRFCGSGGHAFWPDDVSLLDGVLFDLSSVAGQRRLMDVYLLGLAHHRRAGLVTFDGTIPLRAVKGATAAALEIVTPAEQPEARALQSRCNPVVVARGAVVVDC